MIRIPPWAVLVVLAALAVTGLYFKYQADTGAHGGIVAWQSEPAFHYGRRAAAAASDGRYLYVVGGIDDKDHYVTEVEYARVLDNGNLGAWKTASRLNEGRFYLAAVYCRGFLFALGGGSGPRGSDNVPTATVERAAVHADGSLGPWQRAAYLTTPRRALQAVVHGNTIYALGGYNGVFLRSSESAEVGSDGRLGVWHKEPVEATIDRYIHSAAIDGDRVYLFGGHVESGNTMSYGAVELSTIQDGHLGAWQVEASPLNVPRFMAAGFSLRHRLYILGGHDGSQRLASVESTLLDSSGHAGHWRFAPLLPAARSAPAVAVSGSTPYVLGGMSDSGVTNSVWRGRVNVR